MRSRNGTSGCARAGRRLGATARWLGARVTVPLAAALALAVAGPAHADSGPVQAAAGPLSRAEMHVRAAASQASVQTPSVQYTCDFSNYGSGIAPATVAAQYQYADSWPVNNPDDIFLIVPASAGDALSLPPQVSSQLGGVTNFLVETTVQAHNATAATATVAGLSTDTLPNPPTQIPQIIGEGQVTFAAQGTGTVSLPPATFMIVPVVITQSGDTNAQPTITCTTTTAAQDATITVGTASGPFYKCTIDFGGGVTATESDPFTMTVTASGNRTVGATDTVTLASADLATFLLSDLVSGVTADFSANLPVQGAQSGSVKLTGTTTTPSSGPITATGKLVLSKAGTIHLLIPQAFTATLSAQGAGSIGFSCALQTSPAPEGLTLLVSKPSGGGSGGATTEGGGTPAGAPATGGGLGPGSATAPAAARAGAALIAIGGGLLLWARRRRAAGLPGGGPWWAWRRRSS